MDAMVDDARILSKSELDSLTGLSATTRWREMKAGRFPPPLELSVSRRGYSLAQIRAWQADRHNAAEKAAAARLNAPVARQVGRPRKVDDAIARQ
ncbi:AlpA family phage regulatory protein [Mesorhizobium sp. LHD-90]|uniref:helix-turn-helix transcriptional regulator n=1 Tax=Mesorhizobium sp. LHD-90 TaxID=3071414 RepID=UPI0027E1B51C|nr:AlpA family phage regulatory protein [Mesorhizobium sp. LHD-90]MDQ6434570.1 AlpA family phage regulatory protein [Mesorhizobium sp. LHD-90]